MNRALVNDRWSIALLRPFLGVLLVFAAAQGRAQLTTSPQTNLQQLAEAITGTGVTISNPVITCHAEGFGEYSYTGTAMGLSEGVILTTGRRVEAIGPNNVGNKTFQAGTPGDPLLNLVTGRTTYDACKLEFDIVPTGDSLRFDFVFGSEEYNEYVGTQYNDVFGFFISGPGIVGDPGAGSDRNIALVPGTSTPVTINNVNAGSNSGYYFNNAGGSETQYDGYTVGLYARSPVQACQTYHLKLIVADASDRKWDGGVFIEKIESPTIALSTYTQNGGPDLIEACNNGWIRFDRGTPRPTPLTLTYYLQGSATNGTDYAAIGNVNPLVPKLITIPANQSFVDRAVDPLFDLLSEGTETITCILGNPSCPALNIDTIQVNIIDSVFATCTPGGTICQGGAWPFTITGGSNYNWTPAAGLSCTTCPNPSASPTATTTYTATVTDGSCSRVFVRQVRVSALSLSAVVTGVLCSGQSNGAINLSVADGYAPYGYSWSGPGGFTANTQDISGLQPGTYTVTVTDAACTRTQSFNVTAPAALGVSLAPAILPFGQNIACFGGSTGSIDATVSGGTGPYTIAWSGPSGYGSSSIDISGLIAGGYTIAVTDANGCIANASTTLTQTTPVNASITGITPVNCFGDGSGGATASGSGGIPPYAYSWNSAPVQTTPTATALPNGTHTVTVTDGYGCTATANATVPGPTAALGTNLVAQTNVLCFGNSTGSAGISISGGTSPYTTSWNTAPVQSGTTATNLPAGTWTATVTDANSCTTTRNVTITQPASAISASLFAQTNVACFGNSTGSATVSASGGTGPYTYQWNTTPAQNTATATSLPAGTWTCTVRDVNLCATAVSVTIGQPATALNANISAQTNVLCFGGTTGSATIAVSGGTAPYTYAWNTSPAQNSATVSNLAAGTYTCTIADANGCTITRNVTITQPAAALNATISAQTNVLCFGNSTGSATVNVSGGTGPYGYAWNTSPVQTAATATGLAAGVHTCAITDANGCSITRNVTITQPSAALNAGISAQTNVLCFGNNTGSATVNVSGGTATYSYSWNTSPVQATATASNLVAGSHTCTITDANGCTTIASATITQPASALSASISGQTNVLCFGNSTGSATVNASGGTGTLNYSWNTSPVQTTATAIGLAAGSYTCTITDANGCSATRNVTITQPAAALAANISAQTNVLCFGSSTGSATATASGGTGAISYSWNSSPVQTTATASNLPAGVYTCTIADANGCSIAVSTTITQPASALSASLASQTNVLCFGSATGSATVNANGGTGAITYQWNTAPVQTTATATGLVAGTWTCTVRDANNCAVVVNVTITQPTGALSANVAAQTNVSCFGNSTGSATVNASGGTGAYGYSWNTSPVQASATASNLPGGSWTCTITDANGCSTTATATITQPAAAIAISGTVTPATCGSASNGAVDASVTGGTGAYTYAWSGPGGFTANTQDISALASGVYTLVATDANGCAATNSFNVAQPGFFTVSGVTSAYTGGWNVSCFGGSNGAIDMTVSGGTTPYTHAWTGPNGFTSAALDISGLEAGTYNYTLTDDNGCSTSASFTLIQPTAVTFATVSTQPITCNGDANAAVSVAGSGGTAPLGYAWSGPGGSTSTSASISGLQPGAYTLVVSDANGCTDGALNSFTFIDPPLLTANASATSNVDCFGNATGSATANPAGGVAPYTISWNTTPVQTGSNASGLTAGAYTVTVTDAGGCVRTQNVTITQPAAFLGAGITAQTNVLIYGQSTGSATVTATGGTSPYTYLWSNGQTGATATGLAAGTYTVTVTDVNGCTATASVTITQPGSALSASLSGQTNVTCFGGTTGSATVSVAGGTPVYTYSWNSIPVQSGATASNLPAGVYTCTITDANGASTTVSVTITQPAAALSASIAAQTNVDCVGSATGSATASAAGGTPLYTYAWNTTPAQVAATATGLAAGTWTCTITDANGCTTTVSATITEPVGALSAAIIAQTDVDCYANASGNATVAANNGTAPYTYAWSNGQSTATATSLMAGIYTCTITDANGCTTSVSTTIAQPAAAMTAGINSISQATCGTNNGGATAIASGGTGPYTYAWDASPVQNTPALSGVGAGTYTCTVTDANGCTTSVVANITSPGALSIGVVSTTAQTCYGTANGQATVAASGGNTPYTITWNTTPAQSGTTASGLIAGSYTATVTDADGCTASVNVTIDGPASPLVLSIDSVNDVLCHGQSTGGATVSASGGLAPYSIVWNTAPVQNGNTATGLSAGTYTATATDAFGCVNSVTVTIDQPVAPIDGYVDAFQNVNCFGGNDGYAAIEATGGSGSYTIEWNTTPVQYGATATGLTAGMWYVTILDNNGCNTPKLLPVLIEEPAAALSLSYTTSDYNGHGISCIGATDGSISVNTSGGTTAYAYVWTGPNGFTSNSEDISGLEAGTYALGVTDANGCTGGLSITLVPPTVIVATANITTATCGGASNGAIDVNVTGGIGPYTFAWSGPSGFSATTEDISAVPAGVYAVIITGGNGCTSTTAFSVSEPGLFVVSATLSSYNGGNHVSCATSSDGAIDATVTGGTVPYVFQWNGPGGFTANTEDISGLAAGDYELTIIDANGCSTLAQYTLNAPVALFAALAPQTYPSGGNVSCNGATDGAIDATITGGTPGFVIGWSGPNSFSATTEDINGLEPGTYTLTVWDVNGCTASQSVTLNAPSDPVVSLSVSQYNSGDAINCNGSFTGMIDLDISGGLAPYTVDWSGPNGYTNSAIDITSLEAGTYTAVVSDAAGCDTTFTVTLSEPTPVVVTSTVSDFNGFEVGCSGSSDGSIDLAVSGGAGYFTFQWTGSNAFVSTNEDVNGLPAGAYDVVITDLNGCKTFLPFYLDAPPAIAASAVITTAACQGSDNGAIDLAITGGVAPFAVQWTGPGGYNATSEDLSGLYAGIYDVTITDANGCTYSAPFDVNEPGLFVVSATSTVYAGGYGVSCNGASDGAIDLTASGGTSPLFYFWQGPGGFTAINEDISGLAAGTYDLTLTDANGCSYLQSWTITSPTPILIGLAASQFPDGSNVACSGGGDGSIDATIVGGVTPYTIAWSGPGGFISINEDITNLPAGIYTIDVVDAIGCTSSASITLTAPAPINIAVNASLFVSGGNVSCDGESDGSIDLDLSGGSLLYFIDWTGPNGFQSNNEDINGLEAGTYQVTVTDANGCTATAGATLIGPIPILIDLAISQYSGGYSIGCNGATGSVDATVQGGAIPWTYLWTGPGGFTSSDQDLVGVAAGTYDLFVTDAAGCTAVASVTLTEPTPIDMTAIVSDGGNGYEVGCTGDDGAIDITVSGGNGPYIFDWNGTGGFASLSEDLSGLGAGTFVVTITDVNGCIEQASFTLEQAAQLTTTMVITGNVCDGLDDGAIDLTVGGGVPTYSIVWSGPGGFNSTDEDLDSLAGGVYTADILDANGCSAQQSATIAASAALGLSMYVSDYGTYNIPCSGDSAGVLEATISGGAGALDILWSGPGGFSADVPFLSGLLAGSYTLSITDVNGCTLDTTVTLTEPVAPISAVLSAAVQVSGTNVSCSGGSDGSIDLAVSGGSAPYTINWHGPPGVGYTTEDLSGVVAGLYDVVIADANGCTYADSILLTEPDSALTGSIALGQFAGGYNVSCDGSTDGSISVVASGGSGSYQFDWSGPAGFASIADSISGLAEGTYVLTLSDLNGCVYSQTIDLTAPDPLAWNFDADVFNGGVNISCNGANDGAINVSITGGAPFYALAWSGPGGFTSANDSIASLAAGTYCLDVTDANGCTAQQCITLAEPAALTAVATTTPEVCGAGNGSIDLTIVGGSAPYDVTWDNGAVTEDQSGLDAGTYTATINDANGCAFNLPVPVNGSANLDADATVSALVCAGEADGAIDLDLLSGSAPYSFSWSNGASTEDISDLVPGPYDVNVTDANGCTWSGSFYVDDGATLIVDSNVHVYLNGYHVSGPAASDGMISLTPGGGTAPYTFQWSNGANTAGISGLAAGTYTVLITDANGCSIELTFTLEAPNNTVLPTGYSPNGDGYNDSYVVPGLDAYNSNKLIVFNRWGNVVYERINYTNDWSGENSEGGQLPNGTYFVILDIENGRLVLQDYVDLRR